jgi:hypothetical protein
MYQEVPAKLLENVPWVILSQNNQTYPSLKFNCNKIQTGEILMKMSCYMFITNEPLIIQNKISVAIQSFLLESLQFSVHMSSEWLPAAVVSSWLYMCWAATKIWQLCRFCISLCSVHWVLHVAPKKVINRVKVWKFWWPCLGSAVTCPPIWKTLINTSSYVKCSAGEPSHLESTSYMSSLTGHLSTDFLIHFIETFKHFLNVSC